MILHGSVAFGSYSTAYELGESPLNVPLIFFLSGQDSDGGETSYTSRNQVQGKKKGNENTWRMSNEL